MHYHTQLYVGSGDLNSGPTACSVVSIFPNEPPSDAGGNPSISLSFLIVPFAEAGVNGTLLWTSTSAETCGQRHCLPRESEKQSSTSVHSTNISLKMCGKTWVHQTVEAFPCHSLKHAMWVWQPLTWHLHDVWHYNLEMILKYEREHERCMQISHYFT